MPLRQKNYKIGKKFTRFTAFVTLLIFSFSNAPLYSASVKADFPSSSTKEPRLDQVTLPDDLGKIQESYIGSGKETVILIQDAHAIPDAQKNIQRLIAHFQKEYGIDLVALEGAAAKLDSQIFKSFPDKEILQKVFQEYHERGELAGGVAAAIFNESKAVYQGIEDWKLYEEGIGLYLQASQRTPEILKELEVRSLKLEEEKKKIYSKELLELDKILKDFYQNHSNLIEVLKKLSHLKQPAAGSELALLLEESQRQEKDSVNIEREVKVLAEKIKKNLTQKGSDPLRQNGRGGQTPSGFDFAAFNQKYQEFQTSRIQPQAFALFLQEVLASVCHPERSEGSLDSSACGLRMTKELSHSIKNQKRLQDIQGTKLFDDFEYYVKEVKEGLFRNEEERNLNRESENLRLLERFGRLELSHKDWQELKGRIIPSLRAPQGRSNLGDRFVASLLAMTEAHFSFYTTAKKREEAFFVNLQKIMEKEKRQKALVVLGGFHAEGLTEAFKKQGISYLLLTPHIDSLPEQTNYQAHMRGDVSWKDYFEAENGRVNLYNAFVRGTRDRLLEKVEGRRWTVEGKSLQSIPFHLQPSTLHLLKSWRDEIIRDLAEREEIANAHKYTSFIDEVAGKNREDSWRSKWLANIDKFMDTLDQLDLSGQLNEQNVLKFFQPSTTISTAGAVLTDASVAAPIVKGWGGAALMRFRGETPTALSSPAPVTSLRSEARGNLWNFLKQFVKGHEKVIVPNEEEVVSTIQEVTVLANAYELLEPNPFVYQYQKDDLAYWADKKLSRGRLQIEFQTRKVIRDLALETGYTVAGPSGKITSGDLSWWAEQLRDGNKKRDQIKNEFIALAAKRPQQIHETTVRRERQDAITDKAIVRKLAEKYQLFTPNNYAWTFQEGDISWYAEQGYSLERLEQEFAAKQRIREIAQGTNYRVAGASGNITSGDLSYWAEQLISGKPEEEIHTEFLNKARRSEVRLKSYNWTYLSKDQVLYRFEIGIERAANLLEDEVWITMIMHYDRQPGGKIAMGHIFQGETESLIQILNYFAARTYESRRAKSHFEGIFKEYFDKAPYKFSFDSPTENVHLVAYSKLRLIKIELDKLIREGKSLPELVQSLVEI